MKGPGLRTDLDVRRVWHCPKCGRVTRTAGRVTAQRCPCVHDGNWMQLQPPVKREPFRPPPREPAEPTAEELAEQALEEAELSGVEAVHAVEGILTEPAAEPMAVIEECTTIEAEVLAASGPPAPDPDSAAVTPAAAEPATAPEGDADDRFGAGVSDSPAST